MLNFVVGIDLGGTLLRAALIDSEGYIHNKTSLATASKKGSQEIINQICKLTSIVSKSISKDQILGIGISSPGPLNSKKGLILTAPTLVGFKNIPLVKILEERLKLPVFLENDAIAAAIGEHRFGAGQGFNNLVYITVSTGIGGGVIIDGKVLYGFMGMAGHIGHMTIIRNGDKCSCGNQGCWEAYGSGAALTKRAKKYLDTGIKSMISNYSKIDGAAVFDSAKKGDKLALQIVFEESEILGLGITNLLHLYSPEIIILGGGVSNGFDLLIPGINYYIKNHAMLPFHNVKIKPSIHKDNSGLLGASIIVFNNNKSLL